MTSSSLEMPANALSEAIERIVDGADIGSAALAAATRMRSHLAVSAGAATALEEIERAVEIIASDLQQFEAKVRAAEQAGDPTFADHFPEIPRVPSSQEVAAFRKHLSDRFLDYTRARG